MKDEFWTKKEIKAMRKTMQSINKIRDKHDDIKNKNGDELAVMIRSNLSTMNRLSIYFFRKSKQSLDLESVNANNVNGGKIVNQIANVINYVGLDLCEKIYNNIEYPYFVLKAIKSLRVKQIKNPKQKS